MERLRIRFYGSVQGVGFRYRACHSANLLGLTGWVKNCPDGTVLCEIQGSREDIDKMVEMIDSGSYIQITNMKIEKLPLSEGDRGFYIGD